MTSQTQVFWTLMVRGVGMGFLFVPINAVVLGQFRGAELGQTAGLMNLLRQMGGSIGIALIATLLERGTHQNTYDLSSHVSIFNPGTRAALAKAGVTDFSAVSEKVRGMVALRLDQQVYLMSFTQMIWYILLIFSCALIPLYFLKRQAPGPKP